MKCNVIEKSQFRKDYKACAKRNWDMARLKSVMLKLQYQEPLDPIENRPHWLEGFSPRRMECHIANDWLLEYRYDGSDLYFERTGTHSDLFR